MFEISNLPNVLELFLNIIELLALSTSFTTFFFLMINKYSKALKEILSPCGISLFSRVRVLFLCRKSPIKKRAFIEFAILKTQGYTAVSKEWNAIINEFKAYYSDGISELTYNIPNCTTIIGDDFSSAVDRYFSFFSQEKVMKVFGIKEDALKWVIKLHIEEAYTTPTCLLTGLLSQYEENWNEFIKRYVSTAYITESDEDNSTNVLSNELYYTFAWLLWGPSYELRYKDYWAGLCQISYGDESNSVPAIANHNSDVANRLVDKFKENEGRRYGALISADISIYPCKNYFKSIRNYINPENSYFYDKVENESISFAIQIDDFTPCENYKAKKYYCTAYVWILFELEDDNAYDFKPEKSLAFFEHANLTDMNTYQFLVDALIDKAFKHFELIFKNEKFNQRKYRFVCSMNNEITNKFLKKYDEVVRKKDQFSIEVKQRIFIEPKRSPSDAFAEYDAFFTQRKHLNFKEIDIKNKNAVSALGQFYTEVYMDCFPNVNERETFDNFLLYLNKAQNAKDYNYHILLAVDENDNVVGGGVFDYFKSTNAGVIEFLAVKSDMQTSGIGTQLYKKIYSKLVADAYENGKQKLENIFCEIDSPEYSQASIKKYLYFWNKHGFKHLDFAYTQPSLSPAQESVDGLWFTVAKFSNETLSGNYVLQVIYDYMKYAMQIDNPYDNQEYKKMHKELSGRISIDNSPIV